MAEIQSEFKALLKKQGNFAELIDGDEIPASADFGAGKQWKWASKEKEQTVSVTLTHAEGEGYAVEVDFPISKPLTENQIKNSAQELLSLAGTTKGSAFGLRSGNRLVLSKKFFAAEEATDLMKSWLENTVGAKDNVNRIKQELSENLGIDTNVESDRLLMYEYGEPIVLTDEEKQLMLAESGPVV